MLESINMEPETISNTHYCYPVKDTLQSGPLDQHPRGGAHRGGRGDLQKSDYPIQMVKLRNSPYPLDVDPHYVRNGL